MHLQGLYFPRAVVADFAASSLADLAGNAFHGGCCLAAQLAQIVTCAVGVRRRLLSLSSAPVARDDDAASDLDLDNLFE